MRLLRKFGIAAIASSHVLSCASDPPARNIELISIVAGTWGWIDAPSTCAINPHGFDLDLERRELTIRYGQPTQRYDGSEIINSSYSILSIDLADGSLLLSMNDETRTDSEGKPVRWRLRFIEYEGREAYVWERPDLPDQGWGPIVRCTK